MAPSLRAHLRQHALVVCRIDDDRHAGMVLRRAADQRRTADVDVLDALVVAGALGDGRLERIEIDHQQIDRRDAVLGGLRVVLRVAANGQQPAMHLRMQRLHAAVEHLGKAGELGDVLHRRAPSARSAAAVPPVEINSTPMPASSRGERDEARLVGHRKQRAANARIARHSRRLSSAMRAATQFTSVSPKVAPRSTIC